MIYPICKCGNSDGGSGGGGGGDVTELTKKYPFVYDFSSYKISTSSTSYFKPCNVDNNKMVLTLAGYQGGLRIISLTSNGYTVKSSVNSAVPAVNLIDIANDDSFFVYYYNNTLNYVPINSDYTTGTVISVNITDLGYGTNIHKVKILSAARFAVYDYNNTKIGIFKLENGVLVEEKSIDATNLNITADKIGSFKGNLVIYPGNSGNTVGIKVIDVETENVIFEDLRNDQTNKVYTSFEKDDYLFVLCANNVTPYVTTPLLVYEYSNGQFSKKDMQLINFEVKQFVGSMMSVYKQSEGVYIVTTAVASRSELLVLVCDTINGTIETTFCKNNTVNIAYNYCVTIDNNNKLLLVRNEGSYPSYTRVYWGDLFLDKVSTEIKYKDNKYMLSLE